MQFEQEQLARLEGAKVGSRRCPEIDLAEVRLPPQHLEPVPVGDGDDEVDAHGQPPSSGVTSGSTGQSS